MDAQWLNRQFENNPDKGKGDLSEFLNIGASAISKMLSGTRQIKAKEYMLMRQFFGQPIGRPSQPKIKLDTQSYAINDQDNSGWTAKPSVVPATYQVVTVSDASMIPDFLPGERVLIDAASSFQEKSGIYALKDVDTVIIRILEQNSPSKVKISSLSKDMPSKVIAANKIKILGRVVAKLNWL